MQKKTLRFLTYTAVMLAFTLLFQSARYLFPTPNATYVTYIIGTLVNLCLVVAAACANVWAGVVLSVIAPIVALFQGHAQLPMVVPIAVGNIAIAVGAYFGFKGGKKNLWIAFVSAAAKYVLIAFGMVFFALMGVQQLPFAAAVPVAFTQQVVQLVTGLLSIVIAVPVVAGVRRAVKPL